MNHDNNATIAKLIAQELAIALHSVEKTIALLADGATVPFIARYRKEATGALDETQIQDIKTSLERYHELANRKETIISTIKAQERLTPELEKAIADCWDSTALEDLYLPYKPKRRTRAEVARARGLEPLARIIMAQNERNIERRAAAFVSDEVPDTDQAIAGATDIIAEWISENKRVRNTVRSMFRREAVISSSVTRG